MFAPRPNVLCASLVSLAAFTVPTLGCLSQADGPVEGDAASAEALRLEGDLDDEGTLTWVIHNESAEAVAVGCERTWCAFPTVRVEAAQEDGSWQERDAPMHLTERPDAPPALWPGQSATLGGLGALAPGTYRVIARARGPAGDVDVVREISVIGWSEGTFDRAQALAERADAAGCGDVAGTVSAALLSNVEPDLVLDLLAQARDDERWAVLREMYRRGVFVSDLSAEVRRMPQEDVLSFAGLASRYNATRHQPALREVIAERLMDPLDDWDTPAEVDLLHELSLFEQHWPPHAPDTFVARLERGPEQGDALAELIDLIAYASRELFEADSAQILGALRDRCAGATDEITAEACERAITSFTPGFLGGFGRGFGTSSSCGGGWALPWSACRGLADEWQAIREAAQDPRVVLLGGSVEAVFEEMPSGDSASDDGLLF